MYVCMYVAMSTQMSPIQVWCMFVQLHTCVCEFVCVCVFITHENKRTGKQDHAVTRHCSVSPT